ncbi:MAG: sensor histidine kinase, partial [Limisphaerales bacterium]
AAKPLVLARGETRLSQPGRFYRDDERVQDPAAGREFETLPSQPRLEFELRLGDPAALYARALQRAAIFGAVVLAGLATALIGLLAAHRAFHRQLCLNEMKSNFVSSVSHELRAPIASVRLLAESLDRGKITDEGKRRDYFRLIGQECRRLSSLIENVLDFSRIDQGRKQYEFEPTDLTALVRQTVELMRPYAAERQVGLQFDSPPAVNPQASLDGKAIQQALVNLIDNAVKHSPAATAITVTLATPDSSAPVGGAAALSPPNTDSGSLITLSVTDRGPGIPAAELERIFEPFHRLGSELRRETTGVGIGLSIVKHIVEAHRGRMRVESEVGKGSRFVIELPFLAEQRAKA